MLHWKKSVMRCVSCVRGLYRNWFVTSPTVSGIFVEYVVYRTSCVALPVIRWGYKCMPVAQVSLSFVAGPCKSISLPFGNRVEHHAVNHWCRYRARLPQLCFACFAATYFSISLCCQGEDGRINQRTNSLSENS